MTKMMFYCRAIGTTWQNTPLFLGLEIRGDDFFSSETSFEGKWNPNFEMFRRESVAGSVG